MLRGLAILFAFFIPTLFAQAPDTRRLATLLRPLRELDKLTPQQVRQVRTELAAWTDARVRQQVTVDRMNAELEAEGLFPPEHQPDPDDIYPPFEGYLDRITTTVDPSAPDVLQVKLSVGLTCAFDEMALLYDLCSRRRVGIIQEENTNGYVAAGLESVHIGAPDSRGRRIIAASLHVALVHKHLWGRCPARLFPAQQPNAVLTG